MFAQGITAAHVFSNAKIIVVYEVDGKPVEVDLGQTNLIGLEMPNHPMNGDGYAIISKKEK